MLESHEIWGLTKAAYTSPAVGELVIDIPDELRHRRLFGALFFFGGVLTGRASAEVSFESNSAIGSVSSFRWEWGFPAADLTVPNDPLRYPSRGERNIVVLPPFSVAKVQPGEDTQWTQATGIGRDSMVATIPDSDFPASFNVVMHPIPLIASADKIRARLDAVWTVDGGTFTECGAYLVVGCRSSIIPIS